MIKHNEISKNKSVPRDILKGLGIFVLFFFLGIGIAYIFLHYVIFWLMK